MEDAPAVERLLRESWNKGVTWSGFARYATKNKEQFAAAYDRVEIEPEAVERIQAIAKEVRLLVIGADWCGDVVANLPALARLAELNPKIELRIVDRDRHPELMDSFLTNGGKSIPAVIAYEPRATRHAKWGPRPEACQAVMLANKGKRPKEEIIPMIRNWYTEDRNRTLIAEILNLIASVTA